MANTVERKGAAPRNQGIDWKAFLIKAAIGIAVFNLIAALVTWFFVMPRLRP
jgi:hypothetical protein